MRKGETKMKPDFSAYDALYREDDPYTEKDKTNNLFSSILHGIGTCFRFLFKACFSSLFFFVALLGTLCKNKNHHSMF